jgi:two-component sensor histidine kinase
MILLVAGSLSAFAQFKNDSAAQAAYRRLTGLRQDTGKASTLLHVGSYYINKPGTDPADVQMALDCARLALTISRSLRDTGLQIGAHRLLSQVNRERKDSITGQRHSSTALRLAKGHRYPEAEADALMEAANYYDIYKDDEVQKKLQYYGDVLPLLRQALPKSRKLADALKYFADLQEFSGQGDHTSIALLKEALGIYRHLHYEEIQDVYNVLSNAYTTAGNLKEGLRYGLLAARTAARFKDSSMTVCSIYNNLAYTYNNLLENKRCAESLEKALIIADRNADLSSWLIISGNLAIAYTNINQSKRATGVIFKALERCPPDNWRVHAMLVCDLLRIYSTAKNYPAAAQQYDILQKIMREHTLSNIMVENIYAASIHFLLLTGRLDEAEAKLTAFRHFNQKKNNTNLLALIQIEQYAFQVDSAQGRFVSAIRHYRRYKHLDDSLSHRNHDRQVAQLDIEYQTERKDSEIAQKANNIKMLEQQALLQQTVLRGRTLSRNLAITAACLLALLLGISCNRYLIKQRANRELSEQQEEINTQNDYLRDLLNEREWLLKEVHHRVKNNLQIVMSLLNSQSAYLSDPAILAVLRESQNRMNSISLIHQKLYQDDNLSGIFMPAYIGELIEYLRSSFSIQGRIVFEKTIAPVTLDVTQAVPLGLILNEAITNSIKYAFNPTGKGRIIIRLEESAPDGLYMEISDNGIGLPEGFDPMTATSLGVNLMQGLSQQFDAAFSIESRAGVRIKLRWRSKNRTPKNGHIPAMINR